ncbi:MAG: hypothetical protein ABFS30_03650 [Pseudomonadota bacterium]
MKIILIAWFVVTGEAGGKASDGFANRLNRLHQHIACQMAKQIKTKYQLTAFGTELANGVN